MNTGQVVEPVVVAKEKTGARRVADRRITDRSVLMSLHSNLFFLTEPSLSPPALQEKAADP
jgi:hypothetical protein